RPVEVLRRGDQGDARVRREGRHPRLHPSRLAGGGDAPAPGHGARGRGLSRRRGGGLGTDQGLLGDVVGRARARAQRPGRGEGRRPAVLRVHQGPVRHGDPTQPPVHLGFVPLSEGEGGRDPAAQPTGRGQSFPPRDLEWISPPRSGGRYRRWSEAEPGVGGYFYRAGTDASLVSPTMIDLTFPLHAPTGTTLNTKGWLQEAALRCLLNNLDPDVAEDPENLIVYGGRGKAARNHEALSKIVETLQRLENDETLLIQSGKPVGVFRTHDMAPRVLLANSLIVPRWANWDTFDKLEAEGLLMYGQMTAGSWIYIGTQGILQGTYQTFRAIAEKRFGGSLAGTITLTAGLGGMGGAQPLAITMNGGVALCVEVDPHRIQRRLDTAYLDEVSDTL